MPRESPASGWRHLNANRPRGRSRMWRAGRPDSGQAAKSSSASSGSVYRVHPDGTGMRKAFEQDILTMSDVSPDGRWISAWGRLPGGGVAVQAIPLDGGAPVPIYGPRQRCELVARWPLLVLARGTDWLHSQGRSYLIPLPPGGHCRRFRQADFIPSRKWPACRECAGSKKWEWCPVLLLTSTRSIAGPPSGICTGSRFHESRSRRESPANGTIP